MKNELGINDAEDTSESEDGMLDSSQDGGAIIKKRCKIIKKNIENKKVENYHVQTDIKTIEDKIAGMQAKLDQKN